jgi:hypothetical protein
MFPATRHSEHSVRVDEGAPIIQIAAEVEKKT